MTSEREVVRTYFKVLEQKHCHQFFTFNRHEEIVCMQKNSWQFSFLLLKEVIYFCVFSILPILLVIADNTSMKSISTHQAFFILLLLLSSNHSFSAFVTSYFRGAIFVNSLNKLHHFGQILVMNDVRKSAAVNQRKTQLRKTIVGTQTIFGFVAAGFVSISFVIPFLLFLAEVDSLHLLLDWIALKSSWIHFGRVFVLLAGYSEMAQHLGTLHLMVMLYAYSISRCFKNLSYMTAKSKETNITKQKKQWVNKYNQLMVFTSLFIVNQAFQEWGDWALVSVMGSGLLIDVVCNYVVIKLYGRIPLLLYLSIALVAVIIPVVIFAELGIAGKATKEAGDCLESMKLNGLSQSKWKRKKLAAMQHAKCSIGIFF